MANALAWLNDIMQWLGRWFPRLTLVLPTHRMVLCGLGGKASLRGPGLVMHWPITQKPIMVPVVTQSIELSSRCLWIKPDGSVFPKVSFYSVAVQFKVTDPVMAATRALSFHALVDNRVQSAIVSEWDRNTDLPMASIVRGATPEINSALAEYGITLERCDLTSSGDGIAHKALADWSYTDQQNGTRPE